MLKLTVAVLAIVLAGSASAAGWRDLRVDGSSEKAFKQSVALLEDTLSPSRRHAFAQALQEIRVLGSDYFRQLDGLPYDEVIRAADPTGEYRGATR